MSSRSVNKVILLGHLGKDAETKFTASGVSVSKFPLATGKRVKDKDSGEWKDGTDWHNVVIWRSENVADYLLKGKQVYLEGRLESRSYEDKEGVKRYITEVVVQAQDVILLGGGQQNGQSDGRQSGPETRSQPGRQQPVSMPRSARQAAASAKPSDADDYAGQGITDDDVPF